MKQVGNISKCEGNWNNPQVGRIYSTDGCSPTLNTCGGGSHEPKIVQLGNVNPSGKGMNGNVFDENGLAPTLTTNKGEGNKIAIRQATKKGYIECELGGVADLSYPESKPYVSNSFHCHVSEQMSPIEKQDKEGRFWNLFNGGKIQYCRYNLGYNKEAIKTLILRAMDKGFYEGVNLAMCYCEDCGYQQVEMDICPKCGSTMITKIDRMNGYLGFTRVHGETRYNEAKNAEIADRVSM